MFSAYISWACALLSISLFLYSMCGPFGVLLLTYLAFGWFIILGWSSELGWWSVALLMLPWPSLNVAAATIVLCANPRRIPAWCRAVAVLLGAASWFFVLLSMSKTAPEELVGNSLVPQMFAWSVSCSLAAVAILTWTSNPRLQRAALRAAAEPPGR